MLKDSRRIFGSLFFISSLAGCGGGGGSGDGSGATAPPVSFVQITNDLFAGQDLSDFDVQIVPDVVAVVPSGSATFEGFLSAIYEVDVDGNGSNQDVAIGDAVISFAFDTGIVAGSANNFVLYSTESGCGEIPACTLTSVSTLGGTIAITDGVAAGSAFVADLTGELTGTGGFAVPDNTIVGGGFGQTEGDSTLLIWGQSDFLATANGSSEGTVRVVLGGAESN